MLEQAPGTKGGLWTYRRLIDRTLFPGGYPGDISMINWPGNDYRDQSILDRAPLDQARALQDAKRVSLGFLHWVQTESPRPRAAAPGFPEFKPRPDVFGTEDALGKHPYIRECRRIRALKTVLDVGVNDPAFVDLQMAAVTGEINGPAESLVAAAFPAGTRRRFGL